MAHIADAVRVAEGSTSTGTGDIVLAGAYQTPGAAAVDHRAVSSVASNGDTGEFMAVADDGKWLRFIGTYNSGANSLTRTTFLESSTGSNIDFAAGSKVVYLLRASVGDHHVVLTTGNGKGSTNTACRRAATVQSSAGTAIVYADSSTDGATLTITEAGDYAIQYRDTFGSGSGNYFGVTRNSNQLTTTIENITLTHILSVGVNFGAGDSFEASPGVVKLGVGDVIRMNVGGGTMLDNTGVWLYFSIRKIANA